MINISCVWSKTQFVVDCFLTAFDKSTTIVVAVHHWLLLLNQFQNSNYSGAESSVCVFVTVHSVWQHFKPKRFHEWTGHRVIIKRRFILPVQNKLCPGSVCEYMTRFAADGPVVAALSGLSCEKGFVIITGGYFNLQGKSKVWERVTPLNLEKPNFVLLTRVKIHFSVGFKFMHDFLKLWVWEFALKFYM